MQHKLIAPCLDYSYIFRPTESATVFEEPRLLEYLPWAQCFFAFRVLRDKRSLKRDPLDVNLTRSFNLSARLLSIVYLLLYWSIFDQLLTKDSFDSAWNFLIYYASKFSENCSGYLTSAFASFAPFSSFVHLFAMALNARDSFSIAWRVCPQLFGFHSHPDNHDSSMSLAITIVFLAAVLI